jgi:polyhydroxybutyrate depolymerase
MSTSFGALKFGVAGLVVWASSGCSGTPAGSSTNNVGGTANGGATLTGGATVTAGGSDAGGSTSAGGSASTAGSTSAGGASSSTGCGNTNLPAACNTTTTGPCTLNVGGVDRQFYVVLPTNYDASTPVPLVFTWHGLNGTAQQFLPGTYMGGSGGFYGIRSGLPNAIYVTSQGLPSGMNDSGTDYGWPNTNGRDVNFTKAMLDWFQTNFCIDKSRIFSAGMSYGGMMSNTLGCQMPDVFRAIGVMSGALFGRTNSCSTHPIAAWFTHGDADTTVDISGDVTARDMFLQHNGCDTTNTESVAMSDGKTTCTVYTNCTSGDYPVVWCPVPGEGHAIPSWAGGQIAQFFAKF